MQNADVVLSMLAQKSTQNSDFVFDRLYRNLFNPDFFRLAYDNICMKIGYQPTESMQPGTLQKVQETIMLLKHESYRPAPVHHLSTMDGSQTRGQRRSSAPPFHTIDIAMLVQEVIRLLLQAIYEPVFKDSSHGSRPGRSYQTALTQLQATSKGTDWVIEGSIENFFDVISHSRLRAILSRKICDGRFLNLIDTFQHAGYWSYTESLASPMLPAFQLSQTTGAQQNRLQGGIVSPLLANIYLHELDLFMEKRCVYSHYCAQYIRYLDSFIVMIVGSKLLAEQLSAEIKTFLSAELQLECGVEAMTLTNLSDQRVCFLGYEIAKRQRDGFAAYTRSHSARAATLSNESREPIQLFVPGAVIQEQLKPFVARGKAIHHKTRVNLPLPDLLRLYNAEISSLYNYYCLATDVSSKLGKFRYYHYYSLIKTVALKEKCSVKQVISKYGVTVKLKQAAGTRQVFGVTYETQAGTQTMTYFNDSLKKKVIPIAEERYIDSAELNA